MGLGGTSGLDGLFGVSDPRRLSEGWIKVTAPDHPLTAGLRSSLHVFGGFTVKPGSATVLAEVVSNQATAKGGAILEHRVGKGRAVLLAPDLLFSIVHMQQGVPVFQDGKAAPDASAAIFARLGLVYSQLGRHDHGPGGNDYHLQRLVPRQLDRRKRLDCHPDLGDH